MLTGSERLIWAQGSTSTLRAVTTTINGVDLTLASAICWENYMPLLRFSLYSQNVNLYLAPTADARDTWLPLMRTVAFEGRCFVLSANQCVKRKNLPSWIRGQTSRGQTSSGQNGNLRQNSDSGKKARRRSVVTKTKDNHEITWPSAKSPDTSTTPNPSHEESKSPVRFNEIAADDEGNKDTGEAVSSNAPKFHILALPTSDALPQNGESHNPKLETTMDEDEEFVCRGGSCIISPNGTVLAGPVWEAEDELLIASVDYEDCERGRLDLDVAGSYGRMDSFELKVKDLDLNPPP